VERHAITGGVEIDCQISLVDDGTGGEQLSPELESTVYRLVQEALANVAKHARAEHAYVQVGANANCVMVEMRDDGVGFDPDVRAPGFGLVGMKERIALAGGKLEITSSLGAGTTVRAEVPLVRTLSSVS
jgi:signal transduction histidine kinase